MEFLLHVFHGTVLKDSAALFAALLLMLLGPKFRFQVEKRFLSFSTSLALSLEIVMDSVIIQNMVVLRVRDENEPLVNDSFKRWQAIKKRK